jgi:aldo/keto reductase
VNQCEVHPLYQRQDLLEITKGHGTVLQAWAPLAQGRAKVHDEPVLHEIAQRHGKSVAQIMLRWLLQRGIPLVVKSTHASRLRENRDLFDIELTDEEMSAVSALDRQRPNAGMTHQDPRLLEYLHSKYRN